MQSLAVGTVDRLRVRIDDEERLEVLRSYKILDTAPEPEYERLVDVVHSTCKAAWSAVTFVDRDRQWFKAIRGLQERQTPRSMSFCSVGIQQIAPLIVEDALLDARFRNNHLVTTMGLRFFAGYPVFSHDGYGLGSVCVIDTKPRTLMTHQLELLGKAQKWLQADLDRRRSTLEWRDGAHCANSEERSMGERKQALKKLVAEKAWEAVIATPAVAGSGQPRIVSHRKRRAEYTDGMRISPAVLRIALTGLAIALCARQACAWGRDGHRMINHLAAEHLPADVPAFLRDGAALDLMEYLGPEPDRWRNRAEDELSATQAPDHFIDLEYADLLGTLPKRRYDFVRALEAAQPKHPEVALTPEKVGMQPWEVEEIYERLKAAMREYRGLLTAKEDTRPVETVILFYAGWLGHYVADGSMPLHTTYQYNGWTGANPHSYTTEHRIHSQFEAVYVTANVTRKDLEPLVMAAPVKVLQDEWGDYLAYLRRTNAFVEKTYELEKAGGFNGAGSSDAKSFTDERLAAGAIELRDMIDTAWVRSADPVPEYKGAQ